MQNFRAELQELVDGVIDAAGDIIEEEAVEYFIVITGRTLARCGNLNYTSSPDLHSKA